MYVLLGQFICSNLQCLTDVATIFRKITLSQNNPEYLRMSHTLFWKELQIHCVG